MADWEFIATEFLHGNGEAGERVIWEAIVKALKGTGEGIAILNYSDFQRYEQTRYQPDILLVSREWGMAVIEVKTCAIEQIVQIRANQWEMQGFYARHITPFKQGENQLWSILNRCHRQPTLKYRVPGRVIVALPLITRDDFRHRGFADDHPTCPPILFGDELGRRSILNSLEQDAVIFNQSALPLLLDEPQWQQLQAVIVGHPAVPKVIPAIVDTSPAPPAEPLVVPRRGEVLQQFRDWISDVDIQQAKIGMQIPPGPQRIRGIAGSGKTLLLCQKAARMHLQHPDWEIALVFFTRSLYEVLPPAVRQWLEYWSDGEMSPDFTHGKLKVIHAWGGKDKPGLYSILRDRAGVSAVVSEKPTGSIPERFAAACKRLLDSGLVEPSFDAILIDEGQDLAVDGEWKYEDKQTIYWLAWQALRPISPEEPHSKRLIWAYDEAQSLDTLGIPSYGEVFGTELGGILSGSKTGPTYKGGIKKSEVMKKCYRVPGPVLIAAHAIGMGLLRLQGMLSGFTTKQDWERIGYEVTAGTFVSGKQITLSRPSDNSPNPIPKLWGRNPLEFAVYDSYEAQVQAVINQIRHNLEYDNLQPSRDILVLILGSDQDTEAQRPRTGQLPLSLQLQQRLANQLQQAGIPYYIPGAADRNRYPDANNRNADRFWHEDAITVSRLYRAKGHEAPMVYVLGLEAVAQDEANLALRNQLFVALTRSMAWVHLSGVQDSAMHTDYLLYDEIRSVINSGNTLKFTYRKLPKRALADTDE